MNNIQLYLTMGIPSLLVVLNIIQSQRPSDKVDRNAERLNDKIDRLADQQHKESMAFQGYMIPLHERMARLETSN